MTKNIILCSLLLLLGKLAFAQGIEFEQGTWDEALAKAKEEKKVLFVDIYTSWCAPCKVVAKNVFPQQKVGDCYNRNFINFQLDAEKGDGPAIIKKYGVKSFPTFLYLDGNGEVVYRFAGAKNVKEFVEEAEKVRICAEFGGWNKMQADYKAGNNFSDFLWAYYEVTEKHNKAKALNRYLKSLPDKKLFTIEVGKMMGNRDLEVFDFDLIERMVVGRVTLGQQEDEFDFFFTFGLQRLLTKYLDQKTEKGDLKSFEEAMGLKKKFYELSYTIDPDINMCWGRGAFFASDEFLRLRYLCVNANNDEESKGLLENYMEKLIKENPLDSVLRKRVFMESRLKTEPNLIYTYLQWLEEDQQLIASHIINFTNYYWRIMPSEKTTRKRCTMWLNYACKLNPHIPKMSLNAAGLFCRLNHKKDAIQNLELAIEKQAFLLEVSQKLASYDQSKFLSSLRILKNKLRDVQNNKE